MRFFRFFILLMAMAAVSCSHRSETYRQLVQVDSVLFANFPDSAKSLLRGITPETEADSAYYNILKTQTDYLLHITEYDFSHINYSINYYQKHCNTQKLANAYYYKAMIDVDHDLLTKETVLLLKEAEKLSEETIDNALKYKICSALAYSNGTLGNYDESLKYAKKEYLFARKLNNNSDIAYGLLRLSTNYERCGMLDSSKYYINECNKLVQYINNDDKAFVYSLLGESYMSTDIDSAQHYFIRTLEHKKSSIAYQNLMEIYFAKNDSATAKLYRDSALMLAWNKGKIAIYAELAQKYYDNSDIENLKNVTDQILSTHEDILAEDQNKFLLEMQRKFDFELQRQKFRSRVAFTVLFCVLVVAVLVLLYRIRVRRIENRRIAAELKYNKTQKELALTEERIATLQTDKKSSAMELAALKRKVEALRDTMRQNIQQGRKMYDELCVNASPLGWSDSDLLCLFDYLSTLAPEFVSRLDTDYDGLNNGQKLFVIVEQYLKKSDFEICQMFGLEKSSLYNKRNRIVKKRVSAA